MSLEQLRPKFTHNALQQVWRKLNSTSWQTGGWWRVCFTAAGPEHHGVTKSNMNFSKAVDHRWWTKLDHDATGQWREVLQLIYNRMTEREKYIEELKGSRPRPQSDSTMLRWDLQKKFEFNLNKLKRCCKEMWAKIPLQPWETDQVLLKTTMESSASSWIMRCTSSLLFNKDTMVEFVASLLTWG